MESFLSAGRLSWLLPLVFGGLYTAVFFLTWPRLYNDVLGLLLLVGLSAVCLVLAGVGLRGPHKISAVVGLLLNLPVVGLAAYVALSGVSFATKF
jgi:hypothetical protein